jgi:hypothetical protein
VYFNTASRTAADKITAHENRSVKGKSNSVADFILANSSIGMKCGFFRIISG